MNMRSLKTLLVLVLCSTFIESTRRVPARSCKYLFGRMITEMTSIKGEIGNLQENVRDLTSENKELKDKLEDHAENVRDLTSENQELKDKLEDLEVANTALQMQVNGLEETINEEDPQSAFSIHDGNPTYDGNKVIFSKTLSNLGDDYSISTGLFTAETPGFYLFTVNLMKASGDANPVNCYLRRNQGDDDPVGFVEVPGNTDTGVYESSTTVILELEEGETIDLGACSNTEGMASDTSFAGFLLYPKID